MGSGNDAPSESVIAWLMEGDPAIRWQAMRDLRNDPMDAWQAEQRRTVETGWGARLLASQDAGGSWGGGIYAPKWTSTTFTLMALCGIGIPRDCEAAKQGTLLALAELLGVEENEQFHYRLQECDRCIVGMMLQLAAYFGVEDSRIDAIVRNLMSERMPDGAWNCRRHRRPKPHHSSFHTTFNVLEGLREAIESGAAPQSDVLDAEQTALEFMLQHKLFKSDKTDEVIKETFTQLTYPHRWHYNVLRGLVYFSRIRAPRDPRLQDAIHLVLEGRNEDGTWSLHKKHSGKVFFEMEPMGKPSRWVTLRALQVLKWWNEAESSTA